MICGREQNYRRGEQHRAEEKKKRGSDRKRDRGFRSERQTCPRKRKGTRGAILRASQTESSGKAFWDAKEPDRDLSSSESMRITSQPLLPGETRMGPLRPGKRCGRNGERDICRLYLDLHPLVAQELDASPPMIPSMPITPEDRRRTDHHWMQQHADLARLCRRRATPLTLLTQRTGPTAPNAGGIYYPQTAIGFLAPFVDRKFLIGRTAQRAIGLEGEVLPREPTHLEGGSNCGLAIPMGVGVLLFNFGHHWSKLGGAYRIRMQLVPQL